MTDIQWIYEQIVASSQDAVLFADEIGAATPIGHAVFQLFRQGMGQNLADMDFAAVKKVLEAISDR
ncbi:MAG: hypothetical protein KKE59_09060 [Proteobacteria bacterium]|nr:hypothetical protein [Pseudomonadota bacterium]